MRRRCRDALSSDGLRREFARRFGAAFEKHVDVVACNFPTWQCALFMYVNVAVVMRFTHRWDHHLQSYYADPGVVSRFEPLDPTRYFEPLDRRAPAGATGRYRPEVRTAPLQRPDPALPRRARAAAGGTFG